jgi:SAM-dependent methyltransferase
MNIRHAARSLALNLGYDVRRKGSNFYDNLYKRPIDFLRSRNVDLVIDVGANVGQYAASLRKAAYAGWIVSFEPVAAAYEQLAALASKDPRWRTFNMALGDIMRDLPRSMSAMTRCSAPSSRNYRRPQRSTPMLKWCGAKKCRLRGWMTSSQNYQRAERHF